MERTHDYTLEELQGGMSPADMVWSEMTLDEIRQVIFTPEQRERISKFDKDLIISRFMSLAWDIGTQWDVLEGRGTGTDGPYGSTTNRRSMCYKLRKAVGYTYP